MFNVIDGCLLDVEDLEIVNTQVMQPIILGSQLKELNKSFFFNLFKQKGLLKENGEKIGNHPSFRKTPITLRQSTKAINRQITKIVEEDPKDVEQPAKKRNVGS